MNQLVHNEVECPSKVTSRMPSSDPDTMRAVGLFLEIFKGSNREREPLGEFVTPCLAFPGKYEASRSATEGIRSMRVEIEPSALVGRSW